MSDVIFMDEDANSVDNLFLTEKDIEITEIYENIHNVRIFRKNNNYNWIVKTFKKNERKTGIQEMKRLNKLNSVYNVPDIITARFTDTFNFIIMTKLPGKDLFDILCEKIRFSENQVKKIVKKLLLVVWEIHSYDIIHGDIKPENMVYDMVTDDIFLIDFEKKRTIEYCSPEQLQGRMVEKTDSWCIGTTCYTLLHGVRPFTSAHDVKHKIVEYNGSLSRKCADFMENLICRNIEDRYTINEALRHSWLQR